MIPARVPLLCLALLACNSAPAPGSDAAAPSDASADLVVMRGPDLRAPDLATPPDLAAPPDLATPADLATAPDLTKLQPDTDMARPPAKCPANAGYFGMPKPGQLPACGQQGQCNGRTYALDCDGVTCTCSVDKVNGAQFIQMQGTCNNLDDPWANVCGF